MIKKSLILFTILVVTIATVFVILSPGMAEQARSASNEKKASIVIEENVFSPSNLTVEIGTTVAWVNADRDWHKVKGDNFESQEMSRGDVFRYKFDKAGSYKYVDALNPSIKGEITVN